MNYMEGHSNKEAFWWYDKADFQLFVIYINFCSNKFRVFIFIIQLVMIKDTHAKVIYRLDMILFLYQDSDISGKENQH